MQGWDIDAITQLINEPPLPKLKYIITDDKEEFLNRVESRAKHTIVNGACDNLRYLEDLDRVKAVREGTDIFEVFPVLKEWNDK